MSHNLCRLLYNFIQVLDSKTPIYSMLFKLRGRFANIMIAIFFLFTVKIFFGNFFLYFYMTEEITSKHLLSSNQELSPIQGPVMAFPGYGTKISNSPCNYEKRKLAVSISLLVQECKYLGSFG